MLHFFHIWTPRPSSKWFPNEFGDSRADAFRNSVNFVCEKKTRKKPGRIRNKKHIFNHPKNTGFFLGGISEASVYHQTIYNNNKNWITRPFGSISAHVDLRALSPRLLFLAFTALAFPALLALVVPGHGSLSFDPWSFRKAAFRRSAPRFRRDRSCFEAQTAAVSRWDVQVSLIFQCPVIFMYFLLICTRWAPTNYKWSYKPYKWPYKWVTGVITLLIGVITPFITSRGPTLYLPGPSKGCPMVALRRVSIQHPLRFKDSTPTKGSCWHVFILCYIYIYHICSICNQALPRKPVYQRTIDPWFQIGKPI